MKKLPDRQQQEPPRPKAVGALVEAFLRTYEPASSEQEADEVFTMRNLRQYFQAWPIPKMPDPLPPYIEEIEDNGFTMVTLFDGNPAFLCRFRK